VPKVSVCIPTYNSARYLGDAIESVLGQTFDDYELLVCDNASSDETPELCRRYRDPRLRYHRFDQLVGQGANWNRCLSLAGGEHVALLHADDVYRPGFLEVRVRALDADGTIGLAFGAVDLIDEEGQVTGQQVFRTGAFVTPAPGFCRDLLLACVINPVAPVVRRRCYDSAGPFDESRLWGIDWDMWLRLAAHHAVSYSPSIAAAYRVHGGSGSAAGMLGTRRVEEERAMLDRTFIWIAADPALASLLTLRGEADRSLALRALFTAGHNCEAGHMAAARDNLALALALDPTLRARPTVWALLAACRFGPGTYRLFRRLHPL
jgi:glycosyltransferase involved in cell wall biosynthesis